MTRRNVATKHEGTKARRTTKTHRLNLLQTQRLVSMLVMRPLSKNEGMQKVWVDGRPAAEIVEMVVKPNDRLTSFERLEIYNKQYWFRVLDCFGDDFPGLRAVLEEKKFDRLARAYLEAQPSRSFSLRNLGQFLPAFLEERRELTAPYTELALDMVKFEWAQVQAFDGPGYAALTPSDVARISSRPAKARLHVQPYVQLLELQYPLDDFLLALKKKNAAMRSEASNAYDETTVRKQIKTVRRPRRKRVWLAVHRFDNSLYYKRLSREGFEALKALRRGETLEAALAHAISISEMPGQDWAAVVRDWFEIWTQLRWFYSPSQLKTKGTRR